MTRGRLVVHAHFYQPQRVDPFSGRIPADPSAAPFHDWNERIAAECYAPNAELGTLRRISFDVGPTLAGWLAEHDPATWERFVAADRSAGGDRLARAGHGNAMAQPFNHTILPLASAADRRTEVRWGLREFELRFGRRAEGLWLPEAAVDLATLRTLADEGVGHVLLAPWQAETPHIDTRRPYRVELGDGRSIVVAFYDAVLSAAVSFEPDATADAERFAREQVADRLTGTPFSDGTSGLVVIATDAELYGHHQPFRDLFLERLVHPGPGADRRFDVVDLASSVAEAPGRPHPPVRIAERTSWSCHHGVLRWTAECPCAHDGRWKGPLRAALERLAAGIDALTVVRAASLPGRPDPWAARDAYVDVVVGRLEAEAFAAERLAPRAEAADRVALLDLLEAQRWRLAMFASDGWFWAEPDRVETRQVLWSAARAVRLIDPDGRTDLEGRLVADLGLLRSPVSGLDGEALYRRALDAAGQPGPTV